MKRQTRHLTGLVALVACLLAGCIQFGRDRAETVLITPKPRAVSAVAAAARSQIGKTTFYDSAYVALEYPGGDVPIDRGVCTDVVVRALRDSLDMDLQRLVHEDMAEAFSQYPAKWGLDKPDRNIDHRRVPNLQTYFERQGYSLGVSWRSKDYLPGDLVTCETAGSRPHIMVVSDRSTAAGVPLVIHNFGRGAREEDRLFDFPLTGHYRIERQGAARTVQVADGDT